MIYKKKLLKILTKAENWADFTRNLSDYRDSSLSHITKAKELIFEVFGKYYFLADPVHRGNYKNAWLFDEIPKDIISRFNLKSIRDQFSLVLEDKSGRFSLVKTHFVEDESGL